MVPGGEDRRKSGWGGVLPGRDRISYFRLLGSSLVSSQEDYRNGNILLFQQGLSLEICICCLRYNVLDSLFTQGLLHQREGIEKLPSSHFTER